MTQRWIFTEVETDETYTVPINPDSMNNPIGDRQHKGASTTHDPAGRPRAFVTLGAAVQWEFSGVIRTQAHHDALVLWAKKPGIIRITDHLDRTFEVMFTRFEPTDRKPTRSTPWRLRYTMKALLLRRVA